RRRTTSTTCPTSRARGRSATCGGAWRRPVARPGPWLRLTAVFAGLATLLAVVSGAASLGAAHRVLAALALAPPRPRVLASGLVHRRLLVPSVSALVL